MKFQKDIFESLKVYGFDLSLMMWVIFAWFLLWCLWHLLFLSHLRGKNDLNWFALSQVSTVAMAITNSVCFCRALLVVRSYKPVLFILNDTDNHP